MIELGSDGEQITVLLPSDADFVVTLIAPDPWPVDAVITLTFLGSGAPVEWTAVINGASATFDVPAVQVMDVIASAPDTARLRSSRDGGGVLFWGSGPVRVV